MLERKCSPNPEPSSPGPYPFDKARMEASVLQDTYNRHSCKDDSLPLQLQKQYQETGEEAAEFAEKKLCKIQSQLRPDVVTKVGNHDLAPIFLDEIQVGRLLGMGGFSAVYEIRGLTLRAVSDLSPQEDEARARLVSGTEDRSRYVLKHISWEFDRRNKDKYRTAATDLACEALIMRSLDHPHILKIHGQSALGTNGFSSGRLNGYFLILDKLDETLVRRMDTWRRIHTKLCRPALPWRRKRKEEALQDLLLERLFVARDLASALEHIHENGFIHRDVKTLNVGFDSNGSVKLFDFGLARPVPERTADGTLARLSRAGSQCYLAPEVDRSDPYDEKADVFSFGVLFWELMVMSRRRRSDSLVLSREAPTWIEELFRSMVSYEPDLRPSMAHVRKELGRELALLTSGSVTAAVGKMDVKEEEPVDEIDRSLRTQASSV